MARPNLKLFSILIVIAFILAACGSQPTPAPTEEVEPNPPTPTATAEPTAEPTPTKKPLTGPLATAAALSQSVTLVPPTPVGGFDASDVGPEDYAGLITQAYYIVKSNYVRDSFNGVDWDAVFEEYVALAEEVDSREEYYALMSAFIRELNDDHSRYVPPDRMEAEFGVGVGEDDGAPVLSTGLIVWPAKEDEGMMIWCVTRGGASGQAGLERGDIILSIEGNEMVPGEEGWTRAQRSLAIFGAGEDTLTMTVLRGPDSEPEEITLDLNPILGCDGWGHGLVSESPRIGYIRAVDFDGDAAFNLLSAIEDMETEEPLDGLIIDIRHNPGGNSDESMAIFAEGKVGTVGPLREDQQRTIYRIRGPVDWNTETPMAVLTDGNSHSAADYFAAGMQELERAAIVGMPSAGNTEGIISFNLADGTLIRLAVMTLMLNDGTILEGDGVQPDILVPLGDWGLKQEPFDIQLQAAIDYLLGEIE